jgi:hypothetical protein
VVAGEPAYRVFESVQDAARIGRADGAAAAELVADPTLAREATRVAIELHQLTAALYLVAAAAGLIGLALPRTGFGRAGAVDPSRRRRSRTGSPSRASTRCRIRHR